MQFNVYVCDWFRFSFVYYAECMYAECCFDQLDQYKCDILCLVELCYLKIKQKEAYKKIRFKWSKSKESHKA